MSEAFPRSSRNIPWQQRLWLGRLVLHGVMELAPQRSPAHEALIETSDTDKAVELAQVVSRWLAKKTRREGIQLGTVIMGLSTTIASGAIGAGHIAKARYRDQPAPEGGDIVELLRDAAAAYAAEIIGVFPTTKKGDQT